MDILQYNVLDIFQNDDHNIKDKWISSCREFRLRVDNKIEQRHLYEKECSKIKSVYTNNLSELQQEFNTTKSDVDSVILEQKITDKKILNVIKSQEDLKDELKKAKARKEDLVLEMVDLQHEVEERKKKKALQWNAIKRACNIYKVHLDIQISFQEDKDCQFINIFFFTNNEATKNKYFIQLSYSDNHWTILQVEPRIKKEHFNELSVIKVSSECLKVSDITLFLCQIRSIFLKHYMKT
ncbi:PREDICTED: uncharacterized protein LOC108773683 [Cyphomyrmex costatus]|uniref:Kinetochore protein SPC25 n=1 Tax=Cyphomyrmex costatus TaxID=456900 RepID=A0A195CRN2_9HYME|nr:PREDICTED: uncharacterized protein LOC108773683 [Cyphomyrmex costatus]KYN03152.1 hypothetical protein ALC62_06019 [Cyphomyrmex costatus]